MDEYCDVLYTVQPQERRPHTAGSRIPNDAEADTPELASRVSHAISSPQAARIVARIPVLEWKTYLSHDRSDTGSARLAVGGRILRKGKMVPEVGIEPTRGVNLGGF